jgi:hypothetical protein
MDLISQINETVNAGGNPIVFMIVSGIVILVVIMIMQSLLKVALIIGAVTIIGLAAAHYTGYDLSELPMFHFLDEDSSNSSSQFTPNAATTNFTDSTSNNGSSDISGTVSLPDIELPNIANISGGLLGNFQDILRTFLQSIDM